MKANWKTIKNRQNTFNESIKLITDGGNYKSFIEWRRVSFTISLILLAIWISMASFWFTYFTNNISADVQLSWLLNDTQDVTKNSIIWEEEVLWDEQISLEEEISWEEEIAWEEQAAWEDEAAWDEEMILNEIDDSAFEVILDETEEESIETNLDQENANDINNQEDINSQNFEEELTQDEVGNFFDQQVTWETQQEDRWENLSDNQFWNWTEQEDQIQDIVEIPWENLWEDYLGESNFRMNSHTIDSYIINNIEEINKEKYWSLNEDEQILETEIMHWSNEDEIVEIEKFWNIKTSEKNDVKELIHKSAPIKKNLSFTGPGLLLWYNITFAFLPSFLFYRFRKKA